MRLVANFRVFNDLKTNIIQISKEKKRLEVGFSRKDHEWEFFQLNEAYLKKFLF